jgi:peptidoglycan/xylan/chitin deacetylase (PgdA/CDA1 family)
MLKDACKVGLSSAYLLASRGSSMLRRPFGAPPAQLVVLYYHAVREQDKASFAAQMRLLKDSTKVVDAEHAGPLPAGPLYTAITFDDAFVSVRENALPALADLGLRATIFAPSGKLGSRPDWDMESVNAADRQEVVMTASELRELPRSVIRVGSHSVSHPHMPRLSDDLLASELRQSRASLSDVMGYGITSFAFPYGEHDQRVVAATLREGYTRAFGIFPTPARTDSDELLRARRNGA